MGYTHYWSHHDDPTFGQVWPRMVSDAGLIVAAVTEAGVHLARPAGDGVAQVTAAGIRLNGDRAHGQAYESFVIDPPTGTGSGPQRWGFCKTGQKPYDLAVCAILLRCHLLLPEDFLIDSDGRWDGEWNQSRQVVARLFGPVPAATPFSRTI